MFRLGYISVVLKSVEILDQPLKSFCEPGYSFKEFQLPIDTD